MTPFPGRRSEVPGILEGSLLHFKVGETEAESDQGTHCYQSQCQHQVFNPQASAPSASTSCLLPGVGQVEDPLAPLPPRVTQSPGLVP